MGPGRTVLWAFWLLVGFNTSVGYLYLQFRLHPSYRHGEATMITLVSYRVITTYSFLLFSRSFRNPTQLIMHNVLNRCEASWAQFKPTRVWLRFPVNRKATDGSVASLSMWPTRMSFPIVLANTNGISMITFSMIVKLAGRTGIKEIGRSSVPLENVISMLECPALRFTR